MKKSYMFLLIFLALTALASTVYKWVDEKGAIRYSDKPPAGGKSQEVSIQPSPSAEETQKAQERLHSLIKEQQKSQLINEAKEEEQTKHCNYLRSVLTQLLLPGVFSVPMEGGKVLVVPPSGKPALIQIIKKELEDNC